MAVHPLELLFDLCFVVAVARPPPNCITSSPRDVGSGCLAYEMVFSPIWWAWMKFSCSPRYDTDDVLYRLLTLVQIAGVLILAAGYPRRSRLRLYRVVIAMLLIARQMIVQWLRAGVSLPMAGRALDTQWDCDLPAAWIGRLPCPLRGPHFVRHSGCWPSSRPSGPNTTAGPHHGIRRHQRAVRALYADRAR